MIFKRILSNLIDTVLFWLVYFICFVLSELPVDESSSGFLLFLAFLIVILIPIAFVNNSFGKIIMGLPWEEDDALKIKLLVKYLLYFALLSPSLRVSSALHGLIHGTASKTASVVFGDGLIAISFAVTDVLVFMLSRGKYHINDYILNLKIASQSYNRSCWRVLGMTYLFTTSLFCLSVLIIKKNFQPEQLQAHVKSIIYAEQFPTDEVHGSSVLVTKQFTDHVFAPSDPFSFLFDRKFQQKTLFVNLPYEIFQSLEARKRICLFLMNQSMVNDIFSFDKSKQLRIVLSSFKPGRFLNYYNYYRIYYFDEKRPEWGIYGGIKTDSTTVEKYVSFFNKHRQNKSLLLEKQFKMPFAKILKVIEKDTAVRKQFFQQMNLYFDFSWTTHYMNIKLDNAILKFEKIDFNDSPLYSSAQVNFPVTNVMTRFNFVNIFADQIEDADDNIFTLLNVRKITNEYLR